MQLRLLCHCPRPRWKQNRQLKNVNNPNRNVTGSHADEGHRIFFIYVHHEKMTDPDTLFLHMETDQHVSQHRFIQTKILPTDYIYWQVYKSLLTLEDLNSQIVHKHLSCCFPYFSALSHFVQMVPIIRSLKSLQISWIRRLCKIP